MIRFLLKGILHDRSRSLLPVVVVTLGVALSVLLTCWIEGIMTDSLRMNANFNTGHLKVITRALAEDESQVTPDVALTGVDTLTRKLAAAFPDIQWVSRIRFGGLVDFPDSTGNTRAQGPVVGWGIDMVTPGSEEKERFSLEEAVTRGHLPVRPGEALISEAFASRFGIRTGDRFTLFTSTMEGGMALKNFVVSGMVRFGMNSLDRGSIIAHLEDVRDALRMEDASTEILGYQKNDYDHEAATTVMTAFNLTIDTTDLYTPQMIRLKDQGGMADYLDISDRLGGLLVFVFVMAMAVVLWNTGLLGGLRRYTEFGLRLAMGEEKKHIYRTLLVEALLIGIIGSVTGTLLGLGVSWYLQEVGLQFGDAMKNASMMIPTVIRAKIVPSAFYIGFIPGVGAMLLGNALSGRGIYKRQTASLFKELEA
ncbi:MAG TPA: FtsX-like permease family protein [Bacteroidales bacterium]|nr:FtsX-like permease family protein [Bacteroidales bacterium]HRZ48802.1 FtsX-like permease family protein [Bacteroidales bacterium]